MKRMMLTGILALATGLPGLMAQAPQQAQPPAQPAKPAYPTTKSKEEQAAVFAMLTAAQSDPDGAIKAADDLLARFKDTEFKESALFIKTTSYKMKGDNVHAEIFANQVLEANPQSYQAMQTLGEIYATTTRENDLDKEEKLGKAEKLLNDALGLWKTAVKPNPQLPDAQWEETKTYAAATIHNDLGMVALTRKKYDASIAEFKTAVAAFGGEPAFQARLAKAYQMGGKQDEAIALCDKMIADPQTHPQIKQFVQAVKADAMRAKGAAAPPKQ